MRRALWSFVAFHWASLTKTLRALTPAIWLAPFLLGPLIWLASVSPFSRLFDKPHQETFAEWVLMLNLFVILAVYLASRRFAALWLLLFAIALFCRELHFVGTNNGFYIAFVLLVWWASRHRIEFSKQMRPAGMGRLLAAAIWIYLITKTLDRHYWRFLPQYDVWHDWVEESMESVGHLLILAVSVVMWRLVRARRSAAVVKRRPGPG